MLKVINTLTLSLFCFLTTWQSHGQQGHMSYLIDLSVSTPTPRIIHIASSTTLRLEFRNIVPREGYIYNVFTEVQLELIKPLDANWIGGARAPQNTECARLHGELVAAYNALSEVTNEKRAAIAVDSLQIVDRRMQVQDNCTYPINLSAQAVREQIQRTLKTVDHLFTLQRGERLEVTITRSGGVSGDSVYVWTYHFETGPRGEWRTSYGFGVVPYLFSAPEAFYADGADEDFVIREGRRNEYYELIPMIFLSWRPNNNRSSPFTRSIMAGLGIDKSTPVLSLGAGLEYNENLGVRLGMVFHQVDRLRAEYVEGQMVQESLSKDQLHERVYRLNPLVALTFRLNQNPVAPEN